VRSLAAIVPGNWPDLNSPQFWGIATKSRLSL
jgi:hypothetical protein